MITRHGGIDAIAYMRFHVHRHALTRDHEHRRGDGSPDGDLAVPRPRLATASPGVASAAPPTLRVSSPRRSRKLGPLRPLRGSRYALRQPDAFGAGEYPTRLTNAPACRRHEWGLGA